MWLPKFFDKARIKHISYIRFGQVVNHTLI